MIFVLFSACVFFFFMGSDNADYGNFNRFFNWICRPFWFWLALVDYCLVYYWLVFLVLSNISFFGPFSRSFQFSPCKLYIFTVFFFFWKLIFSMNFTCYGFKFSSLPFKKAIHPVCFLKKVLHWSRIKNSFFVSIKKKSSQSFNGLPNLIQIEFKIKLD